jgi:hypothetical protein
MTTTPEIIPETIREQETPQKKRTWFDWILILSLTIGIAIAGLLYFRQLEKTLMTFFPQKDLNQRNDTSSNATIKSSMPSQTTAHIATIISLCASGFVLLYCTVTIITFSRYLRVSFKHPINVIFKYLLSAVKGITAIQALANLLSVFFMDGEALLLWELILTTTICTPSLIFCNLLVYCDANDQNSLFGRFLRFCSPCWINCLLIQYAVIISAFFLDVSLDIYFDQKINFKDPVFYLLNSITKCNSAYKS